MKMNIRTVYNREAGTGHLLTHLRDQKNIYPITNKHNSMKSPRKSNSHSVTKFPVFNTFPPYFPNIRFNNILIGARVSVGAENFSLRHRVQTGSGVHTASYPMGIGGSFLADKAAGA